MRNSQIIRASAILVAMSASSAALAQETSSKCPPGSWFCDESSAGPAATPPASAPPVAAAPPTQPAPATTIVIPSQPTAPPPVVIYQQTPPPPPPVVIVRRPAHLYVQSPPPPPARPTSVRRWGLNLRLEGLMMDDKRNENASMGGIGMSLRARPIPHFALDFGFDAIGGRDYNGNKRSEVPFSVSAMVYANPKSIAQFYMLAGLQWSSARVEFDQDPTRYKIEHYSYFGGQLGAGLEFRMSRAVALNVDLIGFVRGRTDSRARENPEFSNGSKTTNTSGGGLLRGGITFYW